MCEVDDVGTSRSERQINIKDDKENTVETKAKVCDVIRSSETVTR